MRKPCLGCGDLTEDSRCADCTAERQREQHRFYDPKRERPSPSERGYDTQWRKVSARARKTQTWCSDAHLSPCSGPLTTDHSPEAWQAHEQGQPITLAMVDVVCATHNSKRGSSRPGSERASA